MIYAFSGEVGGSGILAVYVCGMVLVIAQSGNRHGILHMFDGLHGFSQIGMFLVLGLLLTPHDCCLFAVPALFAVPVDDSFARPLSVS